MKTIQVEIPVLVGSNGLWSAYGHYAVGNEGPDWGMMADSLQDDNGKYPAVEKKYVVRATLIVPDETPEVVLGTLEA